MSAEKNYFKFETFRLMRRAGSSGRGPSSGETSAQAAIKGIASYVSGQEAGRGGNSGAARANIASGEGGKDAVIRGAATTHWSADSKGAAEGGDYGGSCSSGGSVGSSCDSSSSLNCG